VQHLVRVRAAGKVGTGRLQLYVATERPRSQHASHHRHGRGALAANPVHV